VRSQPQACRDELPPPTAVFGVPLRARQCCLNSVAETVLTAFMSPQTTNRPPTQVHLSRRPSNPTNDGQLCRRKNAVSAIATSPPTVGIGNWMEMDGQMEATMRS
jgi:hypothetical protein